MPQSFITVKGAREHNLKNVDVDLPRDALVVFTGVSGSGKSSLPSARSTPRRSAVISNRSRPRRAGLFHQLAVPDVDEIDGPTVPVYAGFTPAETRRALKRKSEPSYPGTFAGARRHLLQTFATTESAAMKKRVARHLIGADCPTCQGRRLRPEALAVTFAGLDIAGLSRLTLAALLDRLRPYARGDARALATLPRHHPEQAIVAQRIGEDLAARLDVLLELGLGYLTLERSTPTLSPGELQRLRLATQVRSNLFGVVYVLDEPSAGLHPADTEALLRALDRLRSAGNSLFVTASAAPAARHGASVSRFSSSRAPAASPARSIRCSRTGGRGASSHAIHPLSDPRGPAAIVTRSPATAIVSTATADNVRRRHGTRPSSKAVWPITSPFICRENGGPERPGATLVEPSCQRARRRLDGPAADGHLDRRVVERAITRGTSVLGHGVLLRPRSRQGEGSNHRRRSGRFRDL